MTIKAINVRNQFKGTIKEIVVGDVLSEIDVQTASGIVTSVITTRSVKELELVIGSEVIAFVKSTEVSIAKLWERSLEESPLGQIRRQIKPHIRIKHPHPFLRHARRDLPMLVHRTRIHAVAELQCQGEHIHIAG